MRKIIRKFKKKEMVEFSIEVALGGSVSVDGEEEVEFVGDSRLHQIEDISDLLINYSIGPDAFTEKAEYYGEGLEYPTIIEQLDFALSGQ